MLKESEIKKLSDLLFIKIQNYGNLKETLGYATEIKSTFSVEKVTRESKRYLDEIQLLIKEISEIKNVNNNNPYEKFKNSTWGTHEGETIKINDLEDSHLANIIHYKECLSYGRDYTIPYFIMLAKERGLSDDFLECAPIPYFNKNGKWEIFDKDTRRIKEVSEYR